MIKPNELRITNLVEYNNEVRTVAYLFSVSNSGNWNPVPLTEEWLVKFGFEQLPNENKNSKLVVYSLKNPSWMLRKLSNGWGVEFWQGGQDLEYVHQLQNLYFALTGEELTIK